MTSSTETQANWPNLQKLLDAALALPEADRLAWLANSRDIPDALREPLRRLLEVQAGIATRPFLNTLPNVEAGLTPAASVLIGDLIGPYRLLQELGDGGMGSVWLAERADGALKRKVALKLPRLAWASDLAGRMARERDILSSLEHPNIARLYDAGVDRLGRPFLALEYVEGQRLDRYCDANILSIEQRIRLFLQVLDAVQYAHVNLVLHRDIKPANVLVNQRGEIRLLDFGIAKLLDENTEPNHADPHSRTLSRAMTPRYASPEQVQQFRLTLASDIYSLGVFLYELLVGASPLITNSGSRAELEIAIVDAHIRTASRARIPEEVARNRSTSSKRLSRLLRGELDAVIHKAMARNPADRYVSAEALRADLLRWLEGHPVEATPPSRLLALRKFVTRNALAVGLGSAAVAAIVITAGIAVLQAREARLESRRATATRDFLLGLFENANPELHGGRDVTARELLLNADRDLPQPLSREPKVLTEVYSAISNLWGNLGSAEKAMEFSARRIEAARQGGSGALLRDALLDHAEASLQARDAEALASSVSELLKGEAVNYFDDERRSDFLYLSGWVSINIRDLKSAENSFIRSRGLAQTARLLPQTLRSTYGLIRVYILTGRRLEANSLFEETRKIISNSGMPEGERIRRELELVSAIYMLGEYKSGWPAIQDIFERSVLVHGNFSPSQASVYLYWLHWSLKTNQFSKALAWIKAAKFSEARNPERSVKLDLPFELVEAELLLADGDYASAENLLTDIEKYRSPNSTDGSRELSVTKMQLFLLTGRSVDILKEMQGQMWASTDERPLGAAWSAKKFLYEGMARVMQGDLDRALRAFNFAKEASIADIQGNRLQEVLIRLNEEAAQCLVPSLGDRRVAERLLKINSLISELATYFPESNQTLIRARRVFRELSASTGGCGAESPRFKRSEVFFN